MQSFELLSEKFALHFERPHFPNNPPSLYEPNKYFLELGGKRVRPVLCLMGNELFDDINPDAWEVATAVELFHNFTLIHDDIMDKAPLRRGKPTVHEQYGENTALLAGDVMLVAAYDCLNSINTAYMHSIVGLFNKTAREVCEGQQLDMDFEKRDVVTLDEYLHMIGLKTSVLLAACLKLGAILGGASLRNQNLLYEFGKKLGIAFQIQDDYLDTFGDPRKVGKQPGGDIRANKKTFLLVQAMTIATPGQKEEMMQLMKAAPAARTAGMTRLFEECRVNEWALDLKNKFLDDAFAHLEDVAVLSIRKQPLKEMAKFLVRRDY